MNKLKYMGEKDSNEVVRKIDNFLIRFYRKLPFTYLGIFRNSFKEYLDKNQKITLLDVACGDGSLLVNLGLSKNFEITGIDIFQPYLKLAKEKNIYKKLIRGDIRKISNKNKYDIVLASHVLEHLTKKEGKDFLYNIERIARKKVIVVSPIGYFPQGKFDENSHQIHKSFWTVSELMEFGYSVKSHGLKILWGYENVVKKYGVASYLLFIISTLLYPVLILYPGLGTYMICTKNINNER